MTSFLQNLGLHSTAISPLSIPNYAPHFLIGNFLFSYMASNSRWAKMYYGLDHNACPRQDLDKYAEVMVKEGKMERGTLEMLRRQEAAHANNVENFPLFASSLVSSSFLVFGFSGHGG